jgi:hypothetical protein
MLLIPGGDVPTPGAERRTQGQLPEPVLAESLVLPRIE